jgi:hypothetical protein
VSSGFLTPFNLAVQCIGACIYAAQNNSARRGLRAGLDESSRVLTQSFLEKGRPYEFTQLGGEAGFVVVTTAAAAGAPAPVMMQDAPLMYQPQQGGYAPQEAYPQQGGYPAQGAYPQQGGYPAQGAYPQQGYPPQGAPATY